MLSLPAEAVDSRCLAAEQVSTPVRSCAAALVVVVGRGVVVPLACLPLDRRVLDAPALGVLLLFSLPPEAAPLVGVALVFGFFAAAAGGCCGSVVAVCCCKLLAEDGLRGRRCHDVRRGVSFGSIGRASRCLDWAVLSTHSHQ